ncbi:MAG: MgtC/SapB family protein [Balneolaceae bacterium]
MDQVNGIFLDLLVALAIGFLIGTERGWSERKLNEGERIAGVRTFSLIGLLGGLSALLSAEFGEYILAAAFLGVSALAYAAYRQDVKRDEDVGATTAYAILVVFALAAWAASGHHIAALSVTVVILILLGYKPELHSWLRNLKEKEVDAGIKLLVISVLMLPMLPNEGYGPFEALNPYWIWWMVVLISGLSFLGYFAIKFAGNKAGTFLTAVTGGLASSTAVTLSFAQFAKLHKEKNLFMGGVMIASSIMFIRVLVEVSVVNSALLKALWIPISVMFAGVLTGGVWLWFFREEDEASDQIELKNPFQLGMALKFGALLAAILLLSEFVKEWFGDGGIYAVSVASGLMDVDAITLSLSKMAREDLSADTAVIGIVLASATNTLVKGGIFAFFVGFKESLRLILLLLAATGAGLLAAFLVG